MNSFILVNDYPLYKVVKKDNHYYNLYLIIDNKINKLNNLFKSNYILKPTYKEKLNNILYLYYINPINKNKSELKAIYNKKLKLALLIFEEYSFEVTLKKENLTTLSNLTKVLDNKYRYLELRIREFELKQNKDDLCWIFLANVYNIMDSRIILFDIIGDLFKFIDQNISVTYGLVFKNYYSLNLNNSYLEPNLNYYYTLKATLYARIYLDYNQIIIDEEYLKLIKKLSKFEQKYFCFYVIYILVLNINLEEFVSVTNIESYLKCTKDINKFIKKYKELF